MNDAPKSDSRQAMIELINFYVDQDTDADRAAVNDAIDSGVWP